MVVVVEVVVVVVVRHVVERRGRKAVEACVWNVVWPRFGSRID